MSDPKEMFNEAMVKLGEGKSEQFKQITESLASNIFDKGMLPKDAMGLSESLLEGIYGHAYRLYNNGKYRDATQMFRLLIMLDPTAAKYTLGLAACFHMLKEYQNAVTSYALVSFIDPTSPLPYYHSSDCYVQMDAIPLAIAALEETIALSKDNKQYAMVKDRAQFTLDGIRRVMPKESSEKTG